ncbi:MAG: glycosyltransferase family 2 protein [Candidatus Omnitrophica bacterium]|nr:glycosyltransferase family 2 protein [Candidatus Omnitrophota bacterium]
MSGVPVTPPRCDLVLLTWNRRDLLEPCVDRILRHTTLPSRLLIVDNGSTDPETLTYLSGIQGTALVEIEVVRRPSNEGIATAVNAGLARTRAPWVCILNNDIVVTENWLTEMMYVAESSPRIGLVNPFSNECGLAPDQDETTDDVARRCRVNRGRWIETAVCRGFCMLLSRHILQQVGYWDEGFRYMYFEDADYATRVRGAGFDCVVAEGAYVYHYGGATINSDPTRDRWFRENETRFFAKWRQERPQRIACVLTDPQVTSADLSSISARIRRLANRGHRVWVLSVRETVNALPRHLDVTVVPMHRPLASVQALWWILAKKKRLHRIMIPDTSLAHVLQRLEAFHHAFVERVATRSGGD